ncbi:hypothetical protein CRG98_012326 [Punica granatum]|uniref:Retrotransposon Copia-like N-terminal domain-containing protein n=1 Tax=Punica granatum TaxID=22663 RepID=A0A2I0KFM9_PUNGR|nr:hypothetical protein CRG98_012326 [Punica granatum]
MDATTGVAKGFIIATSPYVVTSSDRLGIKIIACTLSGENYLNWSRLMTNALRKKKFGFTDGSSSVACIENAKTLWDDLKERFSEGFVIASAVTYEDSELWDKRLGHPSHGLVFEVVDDYSQANDQGATLHLSSLIRTEWREWTRWLLPPLRSQTGPTGNIVGEEVVGLKLLSAADGIESSFCLPLQRVMDLRLQKELS